MKFNTIVPAQAKQATDYLEKLVKKGHLVEVKRVQQKRSLPQNRYLHLIIGYFGVHFGYTAAEAKIVYKEINADVYHYSKNGHDFQRSSADLSVEEMTKSIDIFRQKSAEMGCPLPTATDQGWLLEIENAIERERYYL